MKRSLLLIAVCLMMSLSAVAASEPKIDAFAGYQYTRFNSGDSGSGINSGNSVIDGTGINLNGWNGSVTGNFTEHLGIAADFSGAYKTEDGVSLKVHTYTFGPVISGRKEGPFVPFAHALFGGFRASVGFNGASAGSNGFAMIVGGGLDARMSDRLGIRVAQFDWESLRSNGSAANKNFRYSAGVVFHF